MGKIIFLSLIVTAILFLNACVNDRAFVADTSSDYNPSEKYSTVVNEIDKSDVSISAERYNFEQEKFQKYLRSRYGT